MPNPMAPLANTTTLKSDLPGNPMQPFPFGRPGQQRHHRRLNDLPTSRSEDQDVNEGLSHRRPHQPPTIRSAVSGPFPVLSPLLRSHRKYRRANRLAGPSPTAQHPSSAKGSNSTPLGKRSSRVSNGNVALETINTGRSIQSASSSSAGLRTGQLDPSADDATQDEPPSELWSRDQGQNGASDTEQVPTTPRISAPLSTEPDSPDLPLAKRPRLDSDKTEKSSPVAVAVKEEVDDASAQLILEGHGKLVHGFDSWPVVG